MVAVCAALTMNAQMYVGGSLGFNSNTVSTDPTVETIGTAVVTTTTSDAKETTFKFAPEFGFKLADNMAVGVVLGFDMSNREPSYNTVTTIVGGAATTVAPKSTTKVKGNNFSIAPYFRYTALTWGNLSLFADAQVTVATGKTTNEVTTGGVKVSADDKVNSFSVAVVPGISYQLNDQINFVAKLGNGLGYFQKKTEPAGDAAYTEKNIGLDLNSLGLSFGMYYNF